MIEYYFENSLVESECASPLRVVTAEEAHDDEADA